MAGRLDKHLIVKPPQKISTNFRSSFSTPFFHSSTNGRIVTSVQNLRMCILQQNFFFFLTFYFTKTNKKTKQKAHFMSNSLAQIWLEKFDTIWPSEIALNGKTNTQMCKRTHVNTRIPTVKLIVTDALAEEMAVTSNLSNLIPPPNFFFPVMPNVHRRLALGADGVTLTATHFDSVQFKVNSTRFSNVLSLTQCCCHQSLAHNVDLLTGST